MRIKAECRRANIARLDGGPRGATIQFHGDKYPRPEGLVEFLRDEGGASRIRDNKVIVQRDWTRDAEKIKGAFAIARDLAAKAEGPVRAAAG